MTRRAIHLALALATLLGAPDHGAHAASDMADVLSAITQAADHAGVASPLPDDAGPDKLIGAIESSVQAAADAGAETVLLGVPSREQRSATAHAAALVLVLSRQAMRRIDALLSRPGPQTDETRRLAIARETIIPLRAARACLWLGACAEGQARADWAARAVAIADETGPATIWAVAERAVVLGLADVMLDEPEKALESLSEARATLHDNPALRESRWLDVEANLATVLATGEARSSDAAYKILDRLEDEPPFKRADGLHAWALALLSADVAHRVGLMHASTNDDPSERTRLVERSVLRYAALLDVRDSTQTDRAARRRDVDERLRRIIAATDVDPTSLPAIAAAAVAAGADEADPAERARAVAMLNQTIKSVPLGHDAFAPDLFFQLGRLEAASDDPQDAARAAEALLRFAALAPTDARTPSALAAACAAALKGPDAPDARTLSLKALRAAVASPVAVPHADAWRLQLARLLSEQMEGQPVESRWPALLEASGALHTVQGQEQRVSAANALASMWLEAIDRVSDEVLTREWKERVATGALSEADAARSLLADASSARANEARAGAALLAAESHLVLDQPKRALEDLSRDAFTTSNAALGGRLARARFLTLIALGRTDDAFGALDDLAAIDRAQALVALAQIERQATESVETSVQGFPPPTPGPGVGVAADILAHGVAWRRANDAPVSEALRLAAARTLLFAGHAAAGADLLTADKERPPSADQLLVLGEAYLAEHEEAAAFDAFRRVVVALEPSQTDDRAYWHAWTRMLEILQRRNPEGARSADIRREVARLRTLDSWKSFPDCKARIEAVARAVGP